MTIPIQTDHPAAIAGWAANLESFRGDLNREARQRLGADLASKVDPSDLVQETMLRAVGGLPRFRGQTAQELGGWLRSILSSSLNHARRHHRDAACRQVQREVSIEVAEEPAGKTDTPSRVMMQSEQRAAMVLALLSLTESDRKIISLRYRESLSFPEIGQRLKISDDTARKQCERAMRRLRVAMGIGDDSVC